MKIGFGCDHAAVALKNVLIEHMKEQGYECVDYGSYDPNAKDNYPEKGLAVAEAIMRGDVDKGVIICGTGVGISLAALLWATQTGGKSEDVSQGYSGLLYAIPIINTVIMPLGTAVLASRLWDLESKEKCCRILLTLQSRASLFFGKAAAALLQIFLMVAVESAGILALGKWAGYTDALDFGQFWWLAAATFTVNAMLFFLWLFLSVRFDNQVPTLAGGMVGSLSGLFASFMPPMVSFFMPWGYYIPLSTARMDWDPETRIVRYYTAPYPVWLLGVTMALCVLFAMMTWNALKRKEV